MAKENNSNSLVVHLGARELALTEPSNWIWRQLPGNIDGDLIDVAELAGGSWLQIDGHYNERKLMEGVNYEVQFVVLLNENLVIDDPVELTLTLSDGTSPTPVAVLVDLNCMPKKEWIGLKVADFTAKNRAGGGDMKFTMKKISNPSKKGIVIIGAVIFPKKI